MILKISGTSGEPLQAQIIAQIKALILRGELNSGYSLPSIRALARAQKVSVITIQRAYDVLEYIGLIKSQPAKGFYVAELSENERLMLAGKSFSEKLEPVLTSAIKEGLNKKDIIEIINSEIDKKFK